MALAVINIIGALTSVVGVGLMIPSLLPDKDDKKTVVRVAAGLSMNEKDDTAGNQPGISLYDIMGRRIGRTAGHSTKIKDGDFMDIKVPFDHNVGKKPTEYISVTNGGDDGLCIAYVALTQPDGTKKAWFGDVGKKCGADWYHSQLKTGDNDHQPACIWIDRDYSYGLRYQGFGFHINDFAATDERAQQYNDRNDLMCDAAPRFKMYEKMTDADYIPFFLPPLEYGQTTLTDVDPKAVLDKRRWVMPKAGPNINKALIDNTDKPKKARRVDPSDTSGSQNFNYVIISSSACHSAKELCGSSVSRGPDFVSLEEQVFCDMDAKRTWPVCSTSKTDGCFDRTTSTMKAGRGLRGRDVDTGLYVPQKSYEKTTHWN